MYRVNLNIGIFKLVTYVTESKLKKCNSYEISENMFLESNFFKVKISK